MKILKIIPSKYRKEFLTVYWEDKDPVKLHEEVLAQFHLEVDKEITEDEYLNIMTLGKKKEALDYAYLILNYCARSEKNMSDRLKRKGFSHETIHSVIEDLKKNNLINDINLADNIAESKFRNNLWGDRKILEELLKKGIDPKKAAETTQRIKGNLEGKIQSEEDRAFNLLLKRSTQIRSEDFHTQYRRLFGYLSRRGFSYDVVEKALEKYRRQNRFKNEPTEE